MDDRDIDNRGVIAMMATGLVVLILLAIVITLPGWIALAVWGLHWFGRAIVFFWAGTMALGFLGMLLFILGGGID